MKQQKLKPQHWIIICVVGLVIMGLAILSSASAIIAYRNFGDNDFYFWNQFFNILIGFVGMIVCLQVPYKKWVDYIPFIMIATLILLVAVFIPGIGNDYGTARSWIRLPSPLPNVQPSEYAKLAMIVYLAFLFDRKKAMIADFREGYIPFVIITGIICGLVAIQPDFGTTLILGTIAVVMFFVAGGKILHLALTGLAGFLGVFVVALNKQYIYNRFIAFLNPFDDALGAGYHIIQSLTAIGSGGFWGQGFGASRFKYEGYLPEAQGDSIFAIAAEELGFLRVVLIVFAFAVIAWQGLKLAQGMKDGFGKYMVVGITTWISAQAFINIMVALSLFPTTGVPLPFVSYGGSSLLASLMAVGILLNIAKHEKSAESRSHGRGQWRSYYSRSQRSRSPYRRKRG